MIFFSFANAYMRSAFCRRAFDTIYSSFQLASEEECWRFLYPQIAHLLKPGDDSVSEDEAYWVGFTYRQLYIETQIPSEELCVMIPPERILLSYAGLHTIDEEAATDRVCEAYGLEKV